MIKGFLSTAFACMALASNAQSIGTGFFITRDGHIATNYHVIEKSKYITIKDQKNNVHSATVLATDEANDLAILKIDSKENLDDYIKIDRSDSVSIGQKVFTLGFPNVSLQGVEVKYTDGTISSIAGVRDQPNSFQISVPVQPGNSGGPLINEAGNAVGVIVAKLSAKAALVSSGSLPENINYAVKSNYLLELARSKKILLDGERSKDRRTTAEVISQAERAVVLIQTEVVHSESKSLKRVEAPQRIHETREFRIAVLSPNAHRTNKGLFETEAASLKRWRAAALDFASANLMDYVIFEGGAYVKNNFELNLAEVENKSIISFDRYKNPKIFFLESARVLENSGFSLSVTNQKFQKFADLIGIDIVLQSAVYTSDRMNITDYFLGYLKDGGLPDNSIFQRRLNIKVINNATLFSTRRFKELAGQYDQNVATQMYVKEANEKIRQLAIDQNIDLILQSEARAPTNIDITLDLIRIIDRR